MSVNEIIKKRRKEVGLTLEEIAKSVGVAKGTVQKWESGYIANIKRDKIMKLAEVLDVNPMVLIHGEIKKDTSEDSNVSHILNGTTRMIPLFESASAGFGALANNYIIDYIPLVINSESEANDTICIKVVGDSMYPKIEDGDVIVVRKQDSVDSGKVGVFLIDGMDAVVKKVVYTTGEDWLELHSFNPEYKTKRFEGIDIKRVKVLGLVKQVIKNI